MNTAPHRNRNRNRKGVALRRIAAGSFGLALALAACSTTPGTDEDLATATPLDCATVIAQQLDLSQPGLPVPPDAADNLGCAWDVFAWNSFAALNWPGNTMPGKRGLPVESSKSTFLGNTDHRAETVWEAFKEKRELFQQDYAKTWNDVENGEEVVRFAKPPNLWKQFGGYCTAAAQKDAGTTSSGPFALDKFHNQLDETAEVQSEALEPNSELCKGHDPNCGINGQVVGPRVWQGTPSDGKPVYYEVKVNYDFFDYVVNPPSTVVSTADGNLVDDSVSALNALQGRIQLPWRSAADPSKKDQLPNPSAVRGYPGTCVPSTGNADATDPGNFVPCSTGAVHMKSAWIQLDPSDTTTNARYHSTTALFYEDTVDLPGGSDRTSCIAIGEFGLIGLHAIQRVKIDQGGSSENPGGAFVFATWEHRSILDASYSHPEDFSYVNLQVNLTGGDVIEGYYPALPNSLPVTRMIPGTPASCGLSAEPTCEVNTAVLKQLRAAGSFWGNYRLVGTQFAPNDCTIDESQPEAPQLVACRQQTLAKLGQPHFLANAVIETNQGLQQFIGLPPGQPRFQPAQWCAQTDKHCSNDGSRLVGPAANLSNFQRASNNVVFQKQALNMGGCQGCHGIAQQNGYSFSFVLLDGQGGAGADTEDDATIPATSLAAGVPVYLRSVSDDTMALAGDSSGKVVAVPIANADTWQVEPFFGSAKLANFAGTVQLYNARLELYLTIGPTSFFSSPTPPNDEVYLNKLVASGDGRSVSAQSFRLVGYSGTNASGHSLMLLNESNSFLVTVQATGATLGQVAPSSGQSASQAFDLVVP